MRNERGADAGTVREAGADGNIARERGADGDTARDAEPGRRLRRDVAWNLVPVVLLGVVGLGLSFAISSWWGPSAFAVFNLVTTAYFALAVVGACGLQYSVLRAVAEQPEDRARVAAVVVGALVPSVVLAAVASRSHARAAGLASDHLAAIWTFTEGGLLLVLLVELFATVQLARGAGWAAWVGRHLSYGARGVFATLAYEINTKLDVWMLGVLVADKAAVGVYALAAALNEGVTQLSVVLQNNMNPMMARLHARGELDELGAMIRRARRWFVPGLVAVCALAAALYPAVIPWLIGNPAFAAGAVPFAILMAGIALASPYLPFSQLLLMARRPGWHTVLLLAVIAINVAGNLTLIPRLGLAGAAASTAGTVVAAALLLRILARRCAGVRL